MTVMAVKKSPPTLTKLWVSVTDIRDSLSRAREFGVQHARQIAELNGRVESRRKELDATLSDLPPAQRIHIVSRALGGLRIRPEAYKPRWPHGASARSRCAAAQGR